MATIETIHPPAAGVVFRDVGWDDYEAMLHIVGDRPIRVTYDQGTMEVFMSSLGHEGDAYLLGRMVDTPTEEFDVPAKGGGSTTHKRRELDRGAEPERCYWFRHNAQHMSGKRQLDLAGRRSSSRPDHRDRPCQQLAGAVPDLRRHGRTRSMAGRPRSASVPSSSARRRIIPAPRPEP